MSLIKNHKKWVVNCWQFVLVTNVIWCLAFTVGSVLCADVNIIQNIDTWNHPVKTVLKKYNVKLYKVELQNNSTYPIFYIKFPYDPMLAHNNNYFHPLYYDTLKANGFWNYAFIDQDNNIRINITWDKSTKTLTEDIHNLE